MQDHNPNQNHGTRRGRQRRWVLRQGFGLPALLLFGAGCLSPEAREQARAKIRFDLEAIGPDGLVGPPDGRRALDYEFCIPADETLLTEVREIDPSIVVMRGSRGRVGCGSEQWLCMGNTHQREARHVLLRLARLPYIERIEENVWE